MISQKLRIESMSSRVLLSGLAYPVFAILVATNSRVKKYTKKFAKSMTPAQRAKTKKLRTHLINLEKFIRKFLRSNSVSYLVKKRSSRISSRISTGNANRDLFRTTCIFDPKADVLTLPTGFVPHRGNHPFGIWQVDFLKTQGLLPTHRICDIGCGDMREGVPLIRYLNSGLYIGYDQSQSALSQGMASLTHNEIKIKKPLILWGYDFNIECFVGSNSCDFVWANSVWTHLNLTIVYRSMERIFEILKVDGKFLATFFDVPLSEYIERRLYRDCSNIKSHFIADVSLPTAKPKKTKYTYPNRNPYHHPSRVLIAIAQKVGYSEAYVHSDLTPKGQSVLVLCK